MTDETQDDIEVVLDDGKKPESVEEQTNPVDELNRQFEALKKDNEKRKEEAAAANRRAAEERAAAEVARNEAHTARTALSDRETDAVESRIAAAQAEAESAEKEFAAAAEAGDFKKQAEAQRRIARSEAKLAQYEATKADLALRKTEPSVVERRQATDPFEDHLTRFTPRTADWMREHRDWVMDRSKNAELGGAHYRALREGYVPDTDEYFAFVEKHIGIGKPEEPPQSPPRTNGASNARRASPMVAPVNGGAGGHSSGASETRDRNTVYLTESEAKRSEDGTIVWNKGERDLKGEVIKDGDPRIGKPIGRQAYAYRKQQLERGGFYDKTYSNG